MCLQLGCGRGREQIKSPEPPRTDRIPQLLSEADQLFSQRDDVEKLRLAYEYVAQAREPEHRNFEVEWKFAKYSLFLGQALTDETEREKILEEGRDAGKIASRIEPDKPHGYFWYGANLAELARMSPITVGYTSVDNIREAMQTVIAIDPRYEGASAYDVLAQIELNTRLFGGKASKAVELLEKALEFEKNNSNIRLHLAQAYLDVERTDLAKQQLLAIVAMNEPNPDYLPEHRRNVAEAKKLLASRF